jgi:hypothetical protein
MVRLAGIGDLEAIAALGKSGCERARLPAPFNVKHWTDFWMGMLTRKQGFIVARTEGDRMLGAIGGMVCPESQSGVPVGVQMFMVSDPRRQAGVLFMVDAFEGECKRRGAKHVALACPANQKRRKMSDALSRLGYREVESIFNKELQ